MSDLTVIPFPQQTPQDDALLAALRACLEQAEKGAVEGFVLIVAKRDGSIIRANGRSDDCHVFRLLGALAHEQHHMHHLIDGQNEITDHLD